MAATIEIGITDTQVVARSPYHPDLPSAAKRLGGRWSPASRSWVFDLRDLERVRELYREIYGTDGVGPDGRTIDLRIHLGAAREFGLLTDAGGRQGELSKFIAGREIARAFSRDGGARLGAGVVLLLGTIGSGGSVKNPTLTISRDAVIVLRDVPEVRALELIEAGQGWILDEKSFA